MPAQSLHLSSEPKERMSARVADAIAVLHSSDTELLAAARAERRYSDTTASFVSEASVYRLLKDHGLIASPAFILMKAADRFANPTTAPNQLWQTDFTYLKVIGWGWFRKVLMTYSSMPSAGRHQRAACQSGREQGWYQTLCYFDLRVLLFLLLTSLRLL